MATHGTKYAWNTHTKELVDAEDVARSGNKEPPGTYVCTHDGQHAMHFVLTQNDRYRIDGYFAHTKSCGHGAGGGCGGGGESVEHARCKYLLKKWIGRYRFLLKSCTCNRSQAQEWECGEGSDGVTIEQVFRAGGSRVFFDACLMRNGKPAVALEVWHTHKTGPEKIASTRAGGIVLAEFATTDILDMEKSILEDEHGSVFELENTNTEYFTCDACVRQKAAWGKVQSQRQETEENRINAEMKRRDEVAGDGLSWEGKTISEWRELGRTTALAIKTRDEQSPAKLHQYSKSNVKCMGCNVWTDEWNCVCASQFCGDEEDKMFKWYSDNNKKWPKEARMCIRCVTVCVSCDENFSLANAIKYGICLRCYNLAEDLKCTRQYEEDSAKREEDRAKREEDEAKREEDREAKREEDRASERRESERLESERLEIEYAARKRKREEEQIEAKVGFRGYPEGFT